MSIPELLERARVQAGLTQAELAMRAGTSQSAVSAYENGRKAPSTATLERLLAATGQRMAMSLDRRPRADLSGPVGRLVRERAREVRLVLNKHGATRPRIFGSVARGEDTENSDLDLLVQLPKGATLTDLAGLVLDLRELLGRNVDVMTDGALDDAMAASVRAEAVPL